MRQIAEQIETSATEIHQIQVKLIWTVTKRKRHNCCMQQRCLSSRRRAIDRVTSGCGELQAKRILRLRCGIVQQADCCLERFFASLPACTVKCGIYHGAQIQSFRESGCPELPCLRYAVFLAVGAQIVHNHIDFFLFRTISRCLFRLICMSVAIQIHDRNLVNRLRRRIPHRQIGRAAPVGLYLFVDLILTDLHKCASRRRDLRRIAMVQHLAAVRRTCDLQAPAETCVGTHFVIHNTCRLLCQKNHMHAQRTPNRKNAVDSLHKIRKSVFKFRKFINYNK